MNDDKSVVELYDLLLKHFSLDELRTLCFRLGVDFDSVEGNGKAGKARELVLFMKRQDRLLDLVEEIQLTRPDVQITAPYDTNESSTSATQATEVTTADVTRKAEEESKAVFKTEISGGEVGQVINIDKLEGGLNINKG
ncbi:MAG: hypothetical protein JSV68_23490 [Anaerolineaceae bacterium]|nr:MAG: hypothetical protein JSV68_23490 [Anaerolineaceae bacterium]